MSKGLPKLNELNESKMIYFFDGDEGGAPEGDAPAEGGDEAAAE